MKMPWIPWGKLSYTYLYVKLWGTLDLIIEINTKSFGMWYLSLKEFVLKKLKCTVCLFTIQDTVSNSEANFKQEMKDLAFRLHLLFLFIMWHFKVSFSTINLPILLHS